MKLSFLHAPASISSSIQCDRMTAPGKLIASSRNWRGRMYCLSMVSSQYKICNHLGSNPDIKTVQVLSDVLNSFSMLSTINGNLVRRFTLFSTGIKLFMFLEPTWVWRTHRWISPRKPSVNQTVRDTPQAFSSMPILSNSHASPGLGCPLSKPSHVLLIPPKITKVSKNYLFDTWKQCKL